MNVRSHEDRLKPRYILVRGQSILCLSSRFAGESAERTPQLPAGDTFLVRGHKSGDVSAYRTVPGIVSSHEYRLKPRYIQYLLATCFDLMELGELGDRAIC